MASAAAVERVEKSHDNARRGDVAGRYSTADGPLDRALLVGRDQIDRNPSILADKPKRRPEVFFPETQQQTGVTAKTGCLRNLPFFRPFHLLVFWGVRVRDFGGATTRRIAG